MSNDGARQTCVSVLKRTVTAFLQKPVTQMDQWTKSEMEEVEYCRKRNGGWATGSLLWPAPDGRKCLACGSLGLQRRCTQETALCMPTQLCARYIFISVRASQSRVNRSHLPLSLPLSLSLTSLTPAGACRRASSLTIAPRPPPNFSPQALSITTTNSTHHFASPLSPHLPLPGKMGLPVWRAPSPEAKDALKADLSAPARSPIRRRSPFAGRRARTARSPRSLRMLDHEVFVYSSRDRSTSRPSSDRHSQAPPAAPELLHRSRADASATMGERSLPPSLPADEDGFARLRRETMYRSMFDTSDPTAHGEAGRTDGQLAALTPNFAPAAASRSARADSAMSPERGRRYRYGPNDIRARVYLPRSSHDFGNGDDSGDDSDNNNAVGFPPLRRMGRRTIADGPLPSSSLRESWSPATTLDGLGDRERSMSPIDDHWDTMHNTVAPDPLPPSVDSSFTSAAASASFSNSHPSSRAGSSNSNSAASSRTHLTVPSRRDSLPNDGFMRACDTSEDDTSSDTEEEDMDMQPSHSSLRSRHRQGYADEPPSRDPTRYSHGIRDRSRVASAYVRSFYNDPPRSRNSGQSLIDQLDGNAESNVEAELQTLDQELRDARAILERLARRGDITDDFWTSVGLPRPQADRVERLQQRERL